MRVRPYQSSDDSAWQDFVNQHGDACLEHDIAWQRIFADTYGYGQRYLVLEDEGGMAGVLPLFSVQVWRMGRCLLSMPFLDCGGPLAASPAHWAHLLEAAKRLGEKESAAYVEMRMLEQAGDGVPTRTDKAKLVLDLAQDAESVWKGLPSVVRNRVRKARKGGLTVKWGGGEQLDAFHRVYARNMRDLGSPAPPPRLFSNTLRHFGERARLITVWRDQTAVAGAVWLRIGSTAYVPWVSALRPYFSLAPNDLLYWQAVEMACDAGCRRFDFGRSTIDSGPYRFKLKWGARALQLYWHYYCRDGVKAPSGFAEDRGLRLAATLWRRLPVGLTNLLGPRIIAHMP